MSGLSSQDDDGFEGAQDSDDGSLGDGTRSLCFHYGHHADPLTLGIRVR